MSKKSSRDKKVKPVKTKVIPGAGGTGLYAAQKAPKSKPAKAALKAEQDTAEELLTKRATAEFSTKELGALMQIPPGGAEPRQIAPTRQFRNVTRDLPEMRVTEPIYDTGGFRLPALNDEDEEPKQ
jgi:hypothetical protein